MSVLSTSITRRALAAGLAMAGLWPGSGARAGVAVPRAQSRALLGRVARWGCQYQHVDVEALAASDLDMVVIDPSLDDDAGRFLTRGECRQLKRKPGGGRRLVIAYLCIGEADTKRWHWPLRYRLNAPSWLGPENPEWPGAHRVEFWNPEWIELATGETNSVLAKILEIGFDGVLLDRVDAFMEWQAYVPAAAARMVEVTRLLAQRARRGSDDFIVIGQNAEPLLADPGFLEILDGHNKESLLTGLSGENLRNRDDDVAWSMNYLQHLQQEGIATFATEYISDCALAEAVCDELLALKFKPFIGRRQLDVLPGGAAEAEGPACA